MPTNIDKLKKKQNTILRPTLKELLAATPDEIYDRARTQCHPLRAQYEIGSKDGWQRSRAKFPTYYNEQRVYTKCTDGKRYSYIRFFGAPDITTPVWIWCSCPYFKYYLEVALSYKGGTDVKTTSGPGDESGGKGKTHPRKPVRNKPPNVRNPSQLLYLCKHLIVAAEIGIKQTKDYASNKYEQDFGSSKSAQTVQASSKPAIPWIQKSYDL